MTGSSAIWDWISLELSKRPDRYADMSSETLLGAFAAVCSTVSFTPQAIKIIRTRETKDISVWMYLLTVTGLAAWAAY